MLSIYNEGTLRFPQPPSQTRVISSDKDYVKSSQLLEWSKHSQEGSYFLIEFSEGEKKEPGPMYEYSFCEFLNTLFSNIQQPVGSPSLELINNQEE
jgi:hypothetical protein